MKRILLFLALAGAGVAGLVVAGGGLSGPAVEGEKPEIPVVAPQPTATSSTTTVPVGQLPGAPKLASKVSLDPAKSVSTAIMREREWVDPLTKERIAIAYYPVYSIHGDDVEPVKADGPGAPSAKWRGMHVTVYRDVARLSRAEADALRRDPEARKALVHYEIDAAEGTANFRLEPSEKGERPIPPRVVIRLSKDVRIVVVSDDHDPSHDTHVTTSDVVVDEGAGTVEGDSEVFAEGPGFSAQGVGLRLDRTQDRVEILRNVTLDMRATASGGSQSPAPFDFGTGAFRPRRLTTAGPVVVSQRGASDRGTLYEAVLTNRVRVEAEDGSVLTAHEVILELEPRGARVAAATPAAPAAPRGPGPTPAEGGRFQLSRMVAEGDVHAESVRRGADATVSRGGGKDAADAATRTVSLETQRLTARFEGSEKDTALLEGATTLRYFGSLPVPPDGSRAARHGLVVATCRDRLAYGPVVGVPRCDAVVDLVGNVRIEGSAREGEAAERLDADRVRLFLQKRSPPKDSPATTQRPDAPARRGGDDPQNDWTAIAFEATGGDVRISGPTVSGRAREMKAFDVDRPDGWHLVLSGPDARLEVAEPERRREADAKPAAAAAPAGAAKPRERKKEWGLDRLEAMNDVRGSLAPRPGDVPVTFTADSLVFVAADGGELRGTDGRNAVLTYAGERGRDSSVKAPLVGFAITDKTTKVWTRLGSHADVWTGTAIDTSAKAAKGQQTIALRSESLLDATAGRSLSGKSMITVKARDGASIESRLEGTPTNRVAATTIHVTLVEDDAPPRPAARPPAEKPGAAAAGAVKPAAKETGAPAEPTRWTLSSESLDLELSTEAGAAGVDALRSLEAKGGVKAKSDATASAAAQRFEGESLSIRRVGTAHRGHLEGAKGSRAVVASDDAELPQRILAPTVDFELAGAALAEATFSPPVAAALHAAVRNEKTKQIERVERIVMKSATGPLKIDRTGRATVEGSTAAPVFVVRSVREAAAKEFGGTIRLEAPRLELRASGPLGSPGTTVDRLVAEGPNTWVEAIGTTGAVTHATGDRLVFDRTTNRLDLTGRDGVQISQPSFEGKGRSFWIDVKTGETHFLGIDLTLEQPR